LPEGVSATSATLAADKDAGELELIANLYAPPAQKEARIRAAARDAGVDVTATVALQVVGDPRRAPPPPLTAASVRVSPVGGFTLKPGESKSVEVRVDRRGYVGPFGLEAVDLPPGVSAAPLSFSSDQDAAQFTITAADNAGAAEKEARLRVLNVAENLTSQASFTVAVADASRAEISRWDASGPVGRLAVSPSGDRFLSSAPGGTLQMWDVNTNKEIRSLSTLPKGSGQDVAFAPDGRGALSEIGGDVVLWDAETGKEVRRFERKRAVESVVGSLVYSSDGGSFFAGGMGAFSVWDVKTGQRLHVFEQPGVALGTVLALSPDDSRVLSSYYDHKPELKEPMTAALWDVKTGVKLRMFDIHVCHLTSLAFSPDGSRALSGDCDKMVRLWDLETGKEIRRFLGHTGPVRCVAFSPNGSRALSCGDDKTVRLWDVETGKELWRFEGHTETVRCVVFLSDGRRALSAGDDKTVRLLRLPD
jgi:WD40 repeat protein